MASLSQAWPDNAGVAELDGRRVGFYVDRECIVCRVCSESAPHNFRLAASEDHDVCFRQPHTPEELAQCYAAMLSCPVEAIGDDAV